MVKIILEDWQVKNLREYFGHNDKTQTAHWAYEVFNKAYKEQCNIPIVSIACRHDYNYKILFDHTAVAVCSKCKKRVKA